MEKTQKKVKDSLIELDQLRKDDIEMRRDLSTYEANVEKKLDFSSKCENIMQTVELRQ